MTKINLIGALVLTLTLGLSACGPALIDWTHDPRYCCGTSDSGESATDSETGGGEGEGDGAK